ncbi:hypothetical protein LguiA_008109 [Lonicera macranthoides]
MPPIQTSAMRNTCQQDSPVLPSVVSACSTTDSNVTTTAGPVRSIRSQQQAQSLGTQSKATIGDDGKKKNKRGVVTGKKTAAIVRSRGKSVLSYDPGVRGILDQNLEGRVVLDIGSCVRDRIPMTYLNYSDMPVESRMIVFNYLSENYIFDPNDDNLIEWIDTKAAGRFRQWKHDCKQEWDKDKDGPVPIEFAHRPAQWESLCAHFNSQSNQKKGAQMSVARKSNKKKDHTAGKVSFAHLAKKQRIDGKVAPHLAAYMDAYSATYPEGTARVRAATDEAVAKIMADRPTTEEGSEASIQLPLDEEIRIIESEIGSSRGTRIRGFGSSVIKEPKKRGPAESVQINLQMAAQIAKQDARIAELEARQKAELEAMEARDTTHRAFQFCKQYKRITDSKAVSVEDIYGLTCIVKKMPKVSLLAVYYAKLTEVFWTSATHLYHAYGWFKLFQLQKSFNKNLNQKDLQLIASSVLLSVLSVPPCDHTRRASHVELEHEKEHNARMANLIGFNLESKLESKEMVSKDVMTYVSKVYQLMKIESLSEMIPFFCLPAVEKISVDAVRHNFIAIKVDHVKGAVVFEEAEHRAKLDEIAEKQRQIERLRKEAILGKATKNPPTKNIQYSQGISSVRSFTWGTPLELAPPAVKYVPPKFGRSESSVQAPSAESNWRSSGKPDDCVPPSSSNKW